MKKLFSILLLALFSFALVSPLLALGSDDDTSVPACCRKNGKHHCEMSMAEHRSSAPAETRLNAPLEKCPYCPPSLAATHSPAMSPSPISTLFASPMTHPSGVAQAESKWRIARDRSRQKRGPPSITI